MGSDERKGGIRSKTITLNASRRLLVNKVPDNPKTRQSQKWVQKKKKQLTNKLSKVAKHSLQNCKQANLTSKR